MDAKLIVRLGNPIVMFFWTFTMFLTGMIADGYCHPSRTHSIALAIGAGVFAELHEFLCCFVWCSLTAWWIGRRMDAVRHESR